MVCLTGNKLVSAMCRVMSFGTLVPDSNIKLNQLTTDIKSYGLSMLVCEAYDVTFHTNIEKGLNRRE